MGRKKSVKKQWSGMPTNIAALKEIKAAVESTHPSFTNIETERCNINDIFQEMHQKYGIPKRVFNNLAKFSYYGNAQESFSKNNEIQDAWDAISDI